MGCFRKSRHRREREEEGEDGDRQMMIEDPVKRRRFIVKVLLIVALNLLITSMFAAVVVFHLPTRRFFRFAWWLVFPALALVITIQILICYWARLFRKSPIKFILLGIFVLGHTILICLAVARYYPTVVFMAFGICTVMVILLILFAKFAPCDFTRCWVLIFVLIIVLCLVGVMALFFSVLILFYAACGILAYSFFLVVDIQLLIGGKTHKNRYSEEDYILAALMIYSDIIHIFKYLLICIGILDG